MKPANLIGGIEKRAIVIQDYDPAWSVTFEMHAAKITKSLSGMDIQVEHIGSTAVPGLAAKPIVDMLLVVVDSSEESSYLPALQRAGYVLRVREPDWHQHRMLRTSELDVQIHVFSRGCPEIDRLLSFRDRLRAYAADRQLYESTKRTLATQDWPDMNAYANAKSEVIESIMSNAR